jgi:hypothetical protein
MKNQELHDKAFNLLEEKGLKLGERMMVRSHFASVYKDEYPFISVKHEKGEVKYYFSDIEEIKNLMFKSEKEVIMANAIFENVKDNFNVNEFIQMLKFTFRILNVSSSWV